MSEYENESRCNPRDETIDAFAPNQRVPLAMAYVRFQRWETPVTAEEALQRGTAFASLVMPFEAMEVAR